MFRLALPLIAFATAASADPGDYGHMMDWGHGHGVGMVFGPILWLIVLGLIVAGIIWFVRRLDHGSQTGGRSDAAAELDMRLARGEIDADEFVARKKLLGG